MQTLIDFKKTVENTVLQQYECISLPVLDTGLNAIVLNIKSNESDQLWSVARGLLDQTGRWPIVAGVMPALLEDAPLNWKEIVRNTDLFSRFYYGEEKPDALDISPSVFIELSNQVDVQDKLEIAYDDRAEYFDLGEELKFQLSDTLSLTGGSPSQEELAAPISETHAGRVKEAIDKYLLTWEQERNYEAKPEDARFEWFYEDPCALILMPTANSFETLAYMHWYGSTRLGTEFHIAMHREWFKTYGAELVGHHGTMLQFRVTRPPSNILDAWELANMHDLISPYTLFSSNTYVRRYAAGLLGYDKWFLHERP